MNIIPLPAPIKGQNTTTVAPKLEPEEAISMVNWFPEPKFVRLRDGVSAFTSTAIGTSKDIPSLFTFVNEGGTSVKLIAGANSSIMNVTTSTPAAITLPGGYTITNDIWDTASFVDSGGNSYTVMCNGTNTPLMYNGTSLAVSAWTGITQTKLKAPLSYKGRLYFIEKDSLSIWYGGTGVSGTTSSALSELNLGSIFSLSGKIIWHGSWSYDFGNGLNEYYAVVTSEGELLTYRGDYPGDTEWSLLSRGVMARPIGYRSFAKYGNDVLILCEDGEIYVLSSIIQKNWTSIAINIGREIKSLAGNVSDALRERWSLFISQRQNKIYVVCPKNINASSVVTSTKIYVGNLATRTAGYIPWCEYFGTPILSMASMQGDIYFGGVDGYIGTMEKGLRYDYVYVNGTLTKRAIYTKLRTSPQRLNGDTRGNVQCLAARPLFVGSGAVKYNIGAELDMGVNAVLSVDSETEDSVVGAIWDESVWNTTRWDSVSLVSKKWRRIYGCGAFVNLRIEGSFMDAVVQLAEISLSVKNGGF